jgi:hypothetical protein
MGIAFCFFGTYCMAGWRDHVYIVRCFERTSICKWMNWVDDSNKSPHEIALLSHTNNPSS